MVEFYNLKKFKDDSAEVIVDKIVHKLIEEGLYSDSLVYRAISTTKSGWRFIRRNGCDKDPSKSQEYRNKALEDYGSGDTSRNDRKATIIIADFVANPRGIFAYSDKGDFAEAIDRVDVEVEGDKHNLFFATLIYNQKNLIESNEMTDAFYFPEGVSPLEVLVAGFCWK
ncbi:hypothetical protein COU57_02600 [Candidatus Pacearchaeota archaeon CG10_big_fil_rev_8_21_14_0_10_32_14]|nr:MAG: hypothetical protein COU57_02600 [Candidatus Pacearchaeota archaeon CG10_big_fil_rev_8_21_14_0_10_32_14]